MTSFHSRTPEGPSQLVPEYHRMVPWVVLEQKHRGMYVGDKLTDDSNWIVPYLRGICSSEPRHSLLPPLEPLIYATNKNRHQGE